MENSKSSVSTEQSIKEAAKRVFLKKGFAGTKTRDISEESGENLALINYYFRSKKNLFQIVMKEIFIEFLESSIPVFNDTNTSIQQKLESFVDRHLNLCLKQPDMPLFVVNEINGNLDCIADPEEQKNERVENTVFHQQLTSEYPETNPEHVLLNTIGMTVYPFLGRAMMCGMQGADDAKFLAFIEERRKMIPIWIMRMLNGTSD